MNQLTPAIQTLSQTLRQLFSKKNLSALDTYEINPTETPNISYHFNISDLTSGTEDRIMISKKEKKESGESTEIGFMKTSITQENTKIYFNTEDQPLIKETPTEPAQPTYLVATLNKIAGFTTFLQNQLDIINQAEEQARIAAEAAKQIEAQHIAELTTQIQNF